MTVKEAIIQALKIGPLDTQGIAIFYEEQTGKITSSAVIRAEIGRSSLASRNAVGQWVLHDDAEMAAQKKKRKKKWRPTKEQERSIWYRDVLEPEHAEEESEEPEPVEDPGELNDSEEDEAGMLCRTDASVKEKKPRPKFFRPRFPR